MDTATKTYPAAGVLLADGWVRSRSWDCYRSFRGYWRLSDRTQLDEFGTSRLLIHSSGTELAMKQASAWRSKEQIVHQSLMAASDE
jgi:hypothetical protein